MIRSRTLAAARPRRQPLAPTLAQPTHTRAFSVRLFPPGPPADPRGGRRASTSAANTDWLTWLKPSSTVATPTRKALVFAGLGSYPHTPQAPTTSSLDIWEKASEALLTPDATMGYFPDNMDEFAGLLQGGGGHGIRGWLRGWVEGRNLDELMARPDVTASFILTSTIAILASEQERSGSSSLLPEGTQFLAGHGFVGTLTALVAAGRLDLQDGVRLARIYASLPCSPPGSGGSSSRFVTTALSARSYHSLSSPSMFVPFDDPLAETPDEPERRRRAMQLILDEVHGLQHEWEFEGNRDWAEASIINSSKVLMVTGTYMAVEQLIDRLQAMTIANPVMDVTLPCPFHTKLMAHAVPKFAEVLNRAYFGPAKEGGPIILDPITTRPLCGPPGNALLAQLTQQLRWHKTLTRLHAQPSPPIDQFLTVGRGAKGLGIMLRGEINKRPDGAPPVTVDPFGYKDEPLDPLYYRSRPTRPIIHAHL
ncbi:hypothetical protein CcaverHIS002_0507890 [Cutaneotrichosporon cavernicola]|uniref:[acyl-carrier-protein] S-malonyltransferase n=1 Tax=Cutaneotrichosporon cavernicola TaxID=279322 RepID=A0AA48L755_9TREE|nr:uncharacterized protein CcaverHIS019_0508470 [Cutaneotrichosporon cavernicola]BEI85388.1 hypothetical protein CcaverHIS002_0507890 [Cutaneotrichosporon cavernicola]BEI93219.1 hypothetical protein CcaverHIS019_0508470 [Cutaneotrichosporon cavernicola]BEJ00996.1 hypothetical protein CcaverHIS631_0508530 [Cutaneotrichosporon cavernicola]BEJ08762.1 hypothetical protein CcaverHIS641_0508560 [Cutaneotrichosporon cavernicola]